MSTVWSVQILASFGLGIYKKLENSDNRGCHGNGEENQHFFTFVFITNYKLNSAKFQKNLFFLFPSHIGRCLIF